MVMIECRLMVWFHINMLFNRKYRNAQPREYLVESEEQAEFIDLLKTIQVKDPAEMGLIHDSMHRVLEFRRLHGAEVTEYTAQLVDALESAPENADLDQIISSAPVRPELIAEWSRIMFGPNTNQF